jgi:thioredoxin reductase (NADPH)
MTETDAVIVGAGPVGLWQVFQFGLLEVRTQVIDSLPAAGGQCIELYPDKPLYDVPGLPRCTGRELTSRLLEQAKPFAPVLHLGHEVATVQAQPDGGFVVGTGAGVVLRCKLIVVAAGAGSFQPRSLKVEGLERFRGSQLHYRLEGSAADMAGQRVVVAGDGELALSWAVALAESGVSAPARVTLLHRREAFTAEPATRARFDALRAAGRLHFAAGQPVAAVERDGRLQALRIATPAGSTEELALDHVLVGLGVSPRLGPIADWGLALERKQVAVDPARFQTSVPGIFAVGDIATYPGKKKLILSGFHEATLAAYAGAQIVFGGEPPALEYTTSSSRLHKLLGVGGS